MDEIRLEQQMADTITFNTINELNNLGKKKKDESLAYLSFLFSYALTQQHWLCDCQIDLIKLYINKSCSSC